MHKTITFLGLILAYGASILLLLCSSVCAKEEGEAPNIILILADDMGTGETSLGGGLIPTPALDSLAKEGMRFTDAHTSSAVCTPTRYGILTGRYNWRSWLKKGVLTNATDPALMDPARLNMPAFLQKAGYHTACIGKWHLGVDWPRLPKGTDLGKDKKGPSWQVDYTKAIKKGPTDVGFDEAFYLLSSLDMAPYVYIRNNKAVSIPTVNKSFPHNEYNKYHRVGAGAENFDASTCLADWASESRRYIKERAKDVSKKPFFLYLPITSPHTPITPGKKFKGMYKQYSWYADFIAETDWVVAEVLDQLKQSGVEDNTLVIFTADNGFAPYVMIPKMIAAGYRPTEEYRGAKAGIYEGGHRVPFIARWPGKITAGSTSDATVCTTDFFTTFADILAKTDEIPENAAEDSFSFYPNLKGEKGAVRPFTIHHSGHGVFAIRKGDWKLIMATGSGGGWDLPWQKYDTTSKIVQLYNLKEDPRESTNLEDVHPEIIQELVGDLAAALHNGRTTPGKKQTNDGWPYRDETILTHFPQLKEK